MLQAPPPPAPPAAIVLVVVDDLGWADLGHGLPGLPGQADHRTPHLAALARESLVFTDAYAAAPNCAPSRASLQTGRYTPRHGVYTVGNPARGRARDRRLVPADNATVLADEEVTLAEVLEAYHSLHVGKWHLGDDPRTQGYDVNVGGFAAGHPKSYFAPYRNPALDDGPEGEYLTARLTDEALRAISTGPDGLFLHLAYYTVHTPHQVPAERVAERQAAGAAHPVYAAMVEALDHELGRVLAALDDAGVGDDALVIVTSDNGGFHSVTDREHLRGYKGTLDEGGVRVPLLVRWRGRVAPGVSDLPVHHVDLLPTLAALAGATPPATVDGVDLSTYLRGGSPPARSALFWHFPAYLEGQSDRFERFRTTPGGALRAGDWKLVEYFEPLLDGASRVELYHLSGDRREAHDVAARFPERAGALRARLRAWRHATGAPVPVEPEPRFRPRDAEAPEGDGA